MLTVKELNKRVQGSSSIDIVKFWQCFWAFLWSRQYTVDSQAVHTYRYVLFKNAFWALFGRFWGDFYSLLNRHPAEPDAGRGRGAEAAAEDAEKQRVSEEGRKKGMGEVKAITPIAQLNYAQLFLIEVRLPLDSSSQRI